MPTTRPSTGIFQFGVFQLDLNAGELRKAGVKIKLQDQPFRVLVVLIEHAGQVVTRDELRQEVWPSNVYVDFDQGLNNAIKKVREALADSADSPRLIETVARHGYRFISPVSAVPAPAHQPRLPLRSRALRNAIAIGFAGLLLAISGYWAWQQSARRSAASTARVTLAVLPFDNLSGDPDQEFFSDGLTEEMIAQLGKLNPDRLTVIARGSVAKYKRSTLSVDQIGTELHADYLVEGSVRHVPDRVRITVHLIRVSDQTDRWAESYDRDVKDILALQDSVARTIANQINIKLAPAEASRLATPRSVDPAAYEAYLKGRYYWNKRTAEGMHKAEIYFQQAIDKDPATASLIPAWLIATAGSPGMGSPLRQKRCRGRTRPRSRPSRSTLVPPKPMLLSDWCWTTNGIGVEQRPNSSARCNWTRATRMPTTGMGTTCRYAVCTRRPCSRRARRPPLTRSTS